MHHITLEGCSPHQNVRQVLYWHLPNNLQYAIALHGTEIFPTPIS